MAGRSGRLSANRRDNRHQKPPAPELQDHYSPGQFVEDVAEVVGLTRGQPVGTASGPPSSSAMVTVISDGSPITQPLRSHPVMRIVSVPSGLPTSLSRIWTAASQWETRPRPNTPREC